MTINDVIAYADEFHPNNISLDLKLRWINEVEAYIQREVMLRHEIKEPYTSADMSETLLAPEPYDEIYVAYLDAKFFYMYHEIAQYKNASERYNAIKTDYIGWYASFHRLRDCEEQT